jgi:hypothetical protein
MDEAVYNRGGGACLTPNDEAQIPAMHVRAAVFHATSLFQHHQPWLTCTTSSTSPNQRRPEAIQQSTTSIRVVRLNVCAPAMQARIVASTTCLTKPLCMLLAGHLQL